MTPSTHKAIVPRIQNVPLEIAQLLGENKRIILEKRYLAKDKAGNIWEDEFGMYRRVAQFVASAEKEEDRKQWEDIFFWLMSSGIFLPNSPALMNLGLEQGTASACYVLGVDDTIDSITQVAREAIMIEKFGGGVGFSLSNIRPEGYPISSTHGKACGPIAVLGYLSAGGTLITQAGKRDGAHMAVLSVYHPDVLSFIHCKENEGDIHNFNISLGADSSFMNAVENDVWLHLDWPLCKGMHNEDSCSLSNAGKFVKARSIFEQAIHGAWLNGEPGMVWLDRMNEDNMVPRLGEIEATNPCFAGDTVIAVADERRFVTIRDLAAIGDDVLVYAFDGTNPVVRTGRYPRKTRSGAAVGRIELENGGVVRVTGDHKMLLKDHTEIEARELKPGDELLSFVMVYGDPDDPMEFKGSKVVSVHADGEEDVYNLTVDDYHNVAILTDISNMAMSYGIIAKQCGEQPLLSGESCNLGSIDLGKLVNIDSEFDFEGFGHVVEYAVRFLDDIIDVNQHPTAQTRNMNILTRKIGLGIMGFADCLVRMGISYSSDEAIEVVHQIGAVLENTSDAYSSYLGAMKGDFPEFEHSLLNTKNGGIWEHMRNSWKRSLAPTGCQIRSNQILTPEGMKSVQLILEEASIDWRNVETHDGGVWFTIPPIEIWTKEGIGVSTKIYYNGKVDTKTITFEDGQQYTFTLNHPLLANRNGQHVWVQVGDLQIGDDIVEVAVNGKLPLEASYVLQDL